MVDYSGALWVPSPNFWVGRQSQQITEVVLHATAGPGAVSWFQNPVSQVSAHFVVDTDGSITQTVLEENAAWHAGVVTPNSVYYNKPNINLTSIGIEHVRDTTNTSPITDKQLAASLALVSDIFRRRGKLTLILHDQIDVGRVCPGPNFPLASFQQLSVENTMDALTSEALARATAANPNIHPNISGAIFQEYKRMVAAWIASGRLRTTDPTPWIRDEKNTGHDSYVALDSGAILHWKQIDDLVYLAEAKERQDIFTRCGWDT